MLYQKFTGLAEAMAILGIASRILYMQSDLLFLGISGFIIVSLLIIHFIDVKKQNQKIRLERQDLIRLSILLVLTVIFMVWWPPLPRLFYGEMIL
jgi:phosphatidylserine synthase